MPVYSPKDIKKKFADLNQYFTTSGAYNARTSWVSAVVTSLGTYDVCKKYSVCNFNVFRT